MPSEPNDIVDYNKQYEGPTKVEDIIERRTNDSRTVRGKMYDSKGDGLPSDLIQTNDYVTNAVRDAVETKHEERAKIIGVKSKKLTRENEFPREDME